MVLVTMKLCGVGSKTLGARDTRGHCQSRWALSSSDPTPRTTQGMLHPLPLSVSLSLSVGSFKRKYGSHNTRLWLMFSMHDQAHTSIFAYFVCRHCSIRVCNVQRRRPRWLPAITRQTNRKVSSVALV